MDTRAFGLLLLTLALPATGCSPREGGSCSGNVGTCTSAQEALWCVNGRFARLPCHGPRACSSVNNQVFCDQSLALVHDRCLPAESGKMACSLDHANLLRCNGTENTLVTDCEGPRHCFVQTVVTDPHGGNVFCDESLVNEGDLCEGGDDACSVDHAKMMICSGGHWRVRSECHGPNHCTVDGEQVHCDVSVATAGIHCDTEGGLACVVGNRSGFLVCRNHVMVSGGSCTDANGCQTDGQQVNCRGVILASVGTPCVAAVGCSADRTQVLRCVQGTYALATACAAGQSCQEAGGQLACVGGAGGGGAQKSTKATR